jgi:hypothetical protein
VVAGIGDQEVTGGVEPHGFGREQVGFERGTPLAPEAGTAGSGHRLDDAGRRDLADPVVSSVGDKDRSVPCDVDAERIAETCLCRRSAVAPVAVEIAASGDRGDDSVRVDLADSM